MPVTNGTDHPSPASPLDLAPVGRFQLVLCALLLAVLVIDGIDIQLLSLVAPAIMQEWQVERATFGPALAGALIGMSAGAMVGGTLGDRLGRLPVLVASTLLFGAATILAGTTDSVPTMAVWRIISGVGFGAAAPNAIALATDWLPARHRSLMTSIMSIGTPAGGMVGATLVLAVLPVWGWRGTFYACGIATLVVAAITVAVVRESPQWLLASGSPDRAQAAIRKVIGPDDAPPPMTSVAVPARQQASFLTRQNLRLNIGTGLGFFSIAFVSYALVAWTAIMLTTLGFAMPAAVGALFAFNIAAVAAAVLAGLIMNRLGTRMTLALASALLAGCGAGLIPVLDGGGTNDSTVQLAQVLIGAAGGFAGAAMAAIYAMMAHGYPAACRSGGLGFGMMLGRAGGIAASLTGGWLLELRGTAVWPFLTTLIVAAVVGLICAFVADRHVPRREQRMTRHPN